MSLIGALQAMSGERVGFRFKHADAVVKRNPQGRSRRGWVMEPVEQTTSRGTKMPAYRIRWRDSVPARKGAIWTAYCWSPRCLG